MSTRTASSDQAAPATALPEYMLCVTGAVRLVLVIDLSRFVDTPDADAFRHLVIGRDAFVVLVTRAHKYDYDCLQQLLQRAEPPRYIGMIGSKRRVRAAFKALLEGGVSREDLARVHAPVGVDIGAETPAEIAVSIAAELIQVRRNVTVTSISSEARVLERMLPEAAAQ